MTFQEFHRQAFALLNAILDELERNPVSTEIEPPADWSELKESINGLAARLILTESLDAAIAEMRGDNRVMLDVVALTTRLASDAEMEIAMKRAFASAPRDQSILPAYPFAAFLIELATEFNPAAWKPRG